MSRSSCFFAHASWCLIGLLPLGCAGEREPARKAIDQIAVAVAAASTDAATFAPEALDRVHARLAALQAEYDRGDYAAVVREAPPVLRQSVDLLDAAAKKKAEAGARLDAEWAKLSTIVPAGLAAVQRRIDELERAPSRRALRSAAPMDVGAIRRSCGEAVSLWSKATGAFANGNMAQAVSTGKDVQRRLAALADTLKMDPSAAPAPAEAPAPIATPVRENAPP